MVRRPTFGGRIETLTPNVSVQRGRAARLALYFQQMYPLHQRVPYGTVHFFAIWWGLQALAGFPVVRVTWVALRGVISIVLFLLLMRLYDELKDTAADVALARSSDPRYCDRVLVTGAVTLDDVSFLRWAVAAALVALNVWPLLSWATLAF